MESMLTFRLVSRRHSSKEFAWRMNRSLSVPNAGLDSYEYIRVRALGYEKGRASRSQRWPLFDSCQVETAWSSLFIGLSPCTATILLTHDQQQNYILGYNSYSMVGTRSPFGPVPSYKWSIDCSISQKSSEIFGLKIYHNEASLCVLCAVKRRQTGFFYRLSEVQKWISQWSGKLLTMGRMPNLWRLLLVLFFAHRLSRFSTWHVTLLTV